ncbi:cytochrome p450 [Moniliophthora roreri MCA 2997]|uniref:Cytochrome p450 n=1 Tax=Moniliophthora roreri (strain MCA 2997) TaxID=1381753 RepID=V2Y3M1_MONRO|nr:cytochrome p450 [Moniliophthora roreri MCA 2997]
MAPHNVLTKAKRTIFIGRVKGFFSSKTETNTVYVERSGTAHIHQISQRPEAYDAILKKATAQLVERLQYDSINCRSPVDLTRYISLWGFDIMANMVLGGGGYESKLLESNDPRNLTRQSKMTMVAFEILGYVPWIYYMLKHLPLTTFRRFENFCTERAAERMSAASVSFQDVFSYWLDPGISLNESDLAIETQSALIAGSETPASMISLLFFFILTHPEWHRRLQEELDDAYQTHGVKLDLDTLAELPILNAVILEGFRLGAVFSGLPRKIPSGGTFLEGYYLPAGTIVSVPIFAYNTNESIFPDPDSFNPARWLEDSDHRATKNQLLTFGAGPFRCVAIKLSYKLARLALARVFLGVNLKVHETFDAGLFWEGIGNARSTTFRRPLNVQVIPRHL